MNCAKCSARMRRAKSFWSNEVIIKGSCPSAARRTPPAQSSARNEGTASDQQLRTKKAPPSERRSLVCLCYVTGHQSKCHARYAGELTGRERKTVTALFAD